VEEGDMQRDSEGIATYATMGSQCEIGAEKK
jgi:hypothetical protein